MKEKDENHPVEVVDKKLRKLLSWINAKEVAETNSRETSKPTGRGLPGLKAFYPQ